MELSTQIPTQILNHLLNDEEYCRRVIPYLKKEYFEGPHKITFDLIVDFVTNHNKIPSGKVLELELKKVQMPEEVLNSVSQLIDEIKEKSKSLNIIEGSLGNKEREVPEYIQLDSKNKITKLVRVPKFSEIPYPTVMEPNLVIEYYSR